MRYILYFIVATLSFSTTAIAQNDDALYKNWGFNAGWNFATPQYPGLDAFKARYDAATGFNHEAMKLGTMSNGGAIGLTFFGGHSAVSFEYHALGLVSTYNMEATAGEGLKEYSFKLFQHAGRWSYGYGIPWGKDGVCGIYAGAGITFGTWDVKVKRPEKDKMQRSNIEDFKGFSLGISPELTIRLKIIELKAFYDYPFMQTDLAPVYDYLYMQAGAASASGDPKLKSRLGNIGVCATFFIPFGKPSPVDNSHRRSGGGNDRDEYERQKMQKDAEQNRRAVDNAEKNIQEERRSNERQHERERRNGR